MTAHRISPADYAAMVVREAQQASAPPSVKAWEIGGAISELRRARDRLRDVGAHKAAAYVARAIKSAEGALRHAQGVADRK